MENKTTVCSFCKTENAESAKHCSACGKPILKKILVKQCPKCKSFFDKEDKHCGLCGDVLIFTEIFEQMDEDTSETEEISNENTIICRHCGGDNFEDFKFCSQCGMSLIGSRKRFCSNCGKESIGNYNACSVCGASLLVEPPKTAKSKNSEFKASKKTKILNSAFLLLFAALTFAFTFLPIFNMKIKVLNVTCVDFKFNAYQSICFAFDNIQNKTDEELAKTKLADDVSDYTQSLENFDNELLTLVALEKIDFSDFLIKSYKLELRNENTQFSASVFYASLASLVFVVTSALALLFATSSFLSCFGIFNEKSDACIISLFITPFALAIATIATKFATGSSATESINMVLITAKTVYPALKWVIIPVAILALCKILQIAKFQRKAFSVKNVVLNGAILLCSILVLVLSTSGVMKTEITTTLKDSNGETEISTPIKADTFEILKNELASKDEASQTAINVLLSTYASYSKQDVKNGDTDFISQLLIVISVIKGSESRVLPFAPTLTFLLLTIILAAITSVIALLGLSSSKNIFSKITLPAFGIVAAAVLTFIFNALCVSAINNAIENVSLNEIISVKASIGIGLLLAFSVATLVLSFIGSAINKSKNKNKAENTTQKQFVF